MTFPTATNPKIVIVGMGPCGLGAAWRLQELQYDHFKIFEKLSYPGGLASSYKDDQGFTWDTGGHVEFSHYFYYDHLLDNLLADEWLYHQRSAWVWVRDRFVPYPFQNNIRHLPKEDLWSCLLGLMEVRNQYSSKASNFQEWLYSIFGKGIAEIFMIPYNHKVWAYAPEKLSCNWIEDRVPVTDLRRVLENIIFQKDDVSWGPNNQFRFPLRGGTGAVWRRLFERLDIRKISFGFELSSLNTNERCVVFQNGLRESFDVLISTIPLDTLILRSDLKDKSAADKLIHSSTHVFGIGLTGNCPEHLENKSWIYFPENDYSFYRVTVFSNYSPFNVPDNARYWSLMAEVSESPDRQIDRKGIKEKIIREMIHAKLIPSPELIVDFWYHYEPYGYPTPSLERDAALNILKELEGYGIYSRGRFGAWKYEVSNQDHSFMQGVEAVNHCILNEEEITVWQPRLVNSGKR